MSTAAGSANRAAARGALRQVAGRFRPFRGRMLASVVLVVVSASLGMVWPLLLQEVLNIALPQHLSGLLAELSIAMILAGVLSNIIMVGQSFVANSLGQEVVHRLRADVYAQVQNMPLEALSGESNSRIQALLASDIGGISDMVTFTAQGALAAVVNLAVACIVMLILSWPLALASLLLASALGGLNHRFTRRSRQIATQRQESVAEMLKAVSEDLTLPGVILGRTLGQSAAQQRKFLDISRQIGVLTRRLRLAGGSAHALVGMTLICIPPVIYWMSGSLLPGLSLGTVIVIATMQVRLSGPIQQLLSLNGQFQSSLVMFQRVFDYLGSEPRQAEATPATRAISKSTGHTVRLREVSFRYPGTGQDALDSVDMTVRAGTTVIAGTSGSGKSTLALLMSGLMAPTGGIIELDGHAASQSELQAGVTLLSQEGITFNASLRDNLLFASPSATDAQLLAALKAASLDGLVDRLADGLDTIVGERGYQLSGGERQRVALARVLLAPTPVLVADEATSALDVATTELIYKSLRANASIQVLVVITHRIPQLAAEDQVVLLEKGQVVEGGTHAALKARGEIYARLLRLQASGLGSEWYAGQSAGATSVR